MNFPKSVEIREVGPREGFQFEGIGMPERIPLSEKVDLILQLAQCGFERIEIASFVSPKHVPQMADAEAICSSVGKTPGVEFTGIYLNDRGLVRALAAEAIAVHGNIMLTASETFSLRNQKRSLADDIEMQKRIAQIYSENQIDVNIGTIMAAFGCNWEGSFPLDHLLSLVDMVGCIAASHGAGLKELCLADTMGHANPEQIRSTVRAVRDHLPDTRIVLHLHDTRGLGISNVYAGLMEGVDCFDSAVGGLGGCPFANHANAAGNIATEEVVLLCEELGITTGLSIEKLVECADQAESIIGHPLPRKIRSFT